VVSVTDPYGRILGFLDQLKYLCSFINFIYYLINYIEYNLFNLL
jgi:hypothetical protein